MKTYFRFRKFLKVCLLLSCAAVPLTLAAALFPGQIQQSLPFSAGWATDATVRKIETLAAGIFALLFLFGLLYLLSEFIFFLKARTTGKFMGHIGTIAPGRPSAKLRKFLEQKRKGSYHNWSVLNNVFLAVAGSKKYPPFLIKGFELKGDHIKLLGHCALFHRSLPPTGHSLKIILNPDMLEETLHLDAVRLNRFFDTIYARMQDALPGILSNPEDSYALTLLGAQIGLWILKSDPALQDLDQSLKQFNFKAASLAQAIRPCLEALTESGYDIRNYKIYADLRK